MIYRPWFNTGKSIGNIWFRHPLHKYEGEVYGVHVQETKPLIFFKGLIITTFSASKPYWDYAESIEEAKKKIDDLLIEEGHTLLENEDLLSLL